MVFGDMPREIISFFKLSNQDLYEESIDCDAVDTHADVENINAAAIEIMREYSCMKNSCFF